MIILNILERNKNNNNNRLRKCGFITGILYNKFINILIKIFLTKNIFFLKFFINKRIILIFKNKKYIALLKKIDVNPINNKIINLDLFLIS